jgi:DNA-binding transcriptional MerR regulator
MKSSGVRREIPIGELAESFGLATHVLHHWESMGLVAAILQAKEAGMGLHDIRAILSAPTPAERNSVLQHQHDELT